MGKIQTVKSRRGTKAAFPSPGGSDGVKKRPVRVESTEQ